MAHRVISREGNRRWRGGVKATLKPTIIGLACLVAACTVPEHMEVRAGKDPRNQDDDVRFRTTYYFRVFDACRAIGDLNGALSQADIVPETDSLYRYRMTGKAFSLFTNVHFESGILKSYEIDPLGANVVFDPENNRFHFKSRRQTEEEAAREDDYRELERLIALYGRYPDEKTLPPSARAKIGLLIERKLEEIGGSRLGVAVSPVAFTPEQVASPIKEKAEEYIKKDQSITNQTPKDEKAKIERQKKDLLGQIRGDLDKLERAAAWRLARARIEEGPEKEESAWVDIKNIVDDLKDKIEHEHEDLAPLVEETRLRLLNQRTRN